MLATVAALVIVLGLMVSLARYVRRQASDQLTKQLLAQLDVLVRSYQTRYEAVPAVPAFIPGPAPGVAATLPTTPIVPVSADDEPLPPERVLQENAAANNRAFVAAMQIEARRYPAEFAELPEAFFADGSLSDAWGTPLVFMPSLHPAIGMAMENRPFFLSAGPDRRFSTLEDNLFSYESEDATRSGEP
jgi:hypothetical protein